MAVGHKAARAALMIVMALPAAACMGDEPAGPAPPSSALRFSTLSAGYYHTCGLAAAAAWCWGRNTFGALGDGSTTDRPLPARVAGGHSFTSLDAGAGHSCALTGAGTAWCWGINDEGQLGDGTFVTRPTPVQVSGGHLFASVSAGHAHSCGLTDAGVAWCWGDDSQGQLGDGGEVQPGKSSVPVRVQSDEHFSSLQAGYYQTCALTTSGNARCWGMNAAGQNGDGTRTPGSAPIAVAGSGTFTSIAPGDRFVCATASGDVWCWGSNQYGQLGVSEPDTSFVPLRIDGLSASSITTSMGTSTIPGAEPYGCAIAGGGRVSCWGGAIGDVRERGPAAPLDDRISAARVAAGPQHICLLSRDDVAYCGGANYAGQLGDGTQTDRAMLLPVHGPPR